MLEWSVFEPVLDFALSDDVIKASSIPVIAGLIGWVTNWLAVKLTFYPLKFVGFPPFLGWQGVVPRKREKMAERLVDNTLSRVSCVRDLYWKMDPKRIEAHLYHHLDENLEEYIDALMRDYHLVVWENLPAIARRKVYADAHQQLPSTVNALMFEIEQRIEELVDIRSLVVEHLCADRTLLNRVFQQCGDREFAFIIRSGAYLGFLFGLGQLALWQSFQQSWLLPFGGLVVGTATNWVALNIIFKPLNPIGIGRLKLQGLFLQRQAEVAEMFSHLVAHELLTTHRFVHALFYGDHQLVVRALAFKHLRPAIDGKLITRTMAQITLGFRGYSELKQIVVDRAMQVSMQSFECKAFNEERAAPVEEMIGSRLKDMSSRQFQDVLRPVFQEDEWILIAIGGFLGVCAGLLQILFLR